MIMQNPRAGRWLEAYVSHLVQLHRLMARNLDEGPEGDSLRDQMDLPWRRMTPEEIRMVRELSTDLYTITDPPATSSESIPAEIDSLIARSLRDEDWVKLLRIVRENATTIPMHAASFLRGYCWSQLGLHDAGAEFFEHAVRLKPDQSDYQACLLSGLVRAGREREAHPFAEKWIANSTDPALLFAASTTLFLNALSPTIDDPGRLHKLAIEVAERAIQQAGQQQSLLDLIVKAYLHIALSHADLDDLNRAKSAWKQAKQLAPNSLDVVLIGGLLEHSDEISVEARHDAARELVGAPGQSLEHSTPRALPFASDMMSHSILPN
jgi:tetratricopeptide (TPR) repeat protein